MKTHKKLIIFFIITLLLVLGYFWFNPLRVYLTFSDKAKIVYIYGDKNIIADASTEDSAALKKILNGKLTFWDEPACGFDSDVSVRFGDKVFCPAGDGCSIVQYRNKYCNLSDGEMKKLRQIMEKYGARFPCAL